MTDARVSFPGELAVVTASEVRTSLWFVIARGELVQEPWLTARGLVVRRVWGHCDLLHVDASVLEVLQ